MIGFSDDQQDARAEQEELFLVLWQCVVKQLVGEWVAEVLWQQWQW